MKAWNAPCEGSLLPHSQLGLVRPRPRSRLDMIVVSKVGVVCRLCQDSVGAWVYEVSGFSASSHYCSSCLGRPLDSVGDPG